MTRSKPEWDVVIPEAVSDDGCTVYGTRVRPGSEQAVTVRPLRDGMPVRPGESIARTRQHPSGVLEVVETLYEPPAGDSPVDHPGPPKVVSDAYRAGYEAIDWGAGRRQDSHGAN